MGATYTAQGRTGRRTLILVGVRRIHLRLTWLDPESTGAFMLPDASSTSSRRSGFPSPGGPERTGKTRSISEPG